MYRWHQIRTVHLEVTSKCNAACPMCLRTVSGGGVNPHLPLSELCLDDIRRIFTHEFIGQLDRLYMCGNYGDPMVARDTIPILRYLKGHNPSLELELFTNGSARPREWWRELASIGTRVRFGIDGLADTNHLYRRGTRFDTIVENLKAFIGAGGEAEWDFIVFRHNEHQVEEARTFAKQLGVKRFNVKKTGRFFSNSQVQVKDRQEVVGKSGELEYYLEKPTRPEYVNPALQREEDIAREYGSLKSFLGKTPITCKTGRERSVYISADGYAFPCCWTANQLYPWYYKARGAPIWKILDQLPEGVESLNAKTHPLKDIVNGPFFQERLPATWKEDSSERLFVCSKTCGSGFDVFKAQFEAARFQKEAPPSPGIRA